MSNFRLAIQTLFQPVILYPRVDRLNNGHDEPDHAYQHSRPRPKTGHGTTCTPSIPWRLGGSTSSDNADGQNSVPAWGSYLYQNFLLPAFSPSEWLNSNTPGGLNISNDYFGAQPTASSSSSYLSSVMPSRTSSSQPYSQSSNSQPPQYFYQQPPSAIPTSLLQSRPANINMQSVEVIDRLVQSPSPVSQSRETPLPSPKRGAKRRASSLDSGVSHEDDMDLPQDYHDHEIAEGVERDGMIWGMKVEDYRALSARERKRVRNRISARTFRAKRKGEQIVITAYNC